MARDLEIRVEDLGEIRHPQVIEFSGLNLTIEEEGFRLSGVWHHSGVELDEVSRTEVALYLKEVLGMDEIRRGAEIAVIQRTIYLAIANRYQSRK